MRAGGRVVCVLACAVALGALGGTARGAGPERRIQPGAAGNLSAKLLDGGRVQLENEHLRCVFDPADEGSASSLFYKDTGKELAVSLTYNEKHFNAFRETLHGPAMGGARMRLDPIGQKYELVRLEVQGGKAVAAFTGYPYLPADPVKGADAAFGKVRIIKTYTLHDGSTRLDVEVRAVNENAQALALSVWLAPGGFRVEEEYIDNFAPGPGGTVVGTDPWVKGGSTSVVLPEAAGGWNAAVGADKARTGLYVAGRAEQIETISNYLIKFNGFMFGMGTRLYDVPPGGELAAPYSFVATREITRIDAASPDLACGIDADVKKLKPGQPAEVVVMAASPVATEATATVTLRKLPGGEAAPLGEASFALEAGKGASAKVSAPLDGEGTYVLAVVVKTREGRTLRAERPLQVGLSAEAYQAPMPEREGKTHWAAIMGERPLPAWMEECDRTLRYPMVPWNAPAARPFKVLFVGGEVNWTTGMFRDLARRADAEWDFVNLEWPTGAAEYRRTEQGLALAKLAKFQPDVVLTAGVRYAGIPQDFVNALLARVREGTGLVLVGGADKGSAGSWPALLARDECKGIEADIDGILAGFVKTRIAQSYLLETKCYAFGKGRIVNIPTNVVGYRNNLLLRHRGRTELPDWEYAFARYVRALRFAAQRETGVRITDVKLAPGGAEVSYDSDAEREGTVALDLASTDLFDIRRVTAPARLERGAGTVRVALEPVLSAEYVVHSWLLDGKVEEKPSQAAPGDMSALLREKARPEGGRVLDFDARPAAAAPGVAADVQVKDSEVAVPSGVSVALSKAEGRAAGYAVELRLYNGDEGRLAWEGRRECAPGGRVSFDGFAYTPVSPESVAVVRVLDGDRAVGGARRAFEARRLNCIAEDDIAYMTVSGQVERWYVTETMRPWAENEAGIDLVDFPYGGDLHWTRQRGNTMEPPIVDETPLRRAMSTSLPAMWRKGTAWLCLDDELRLGGEYDFSEPTLKVFRERLRATYGTIEKLNAEWGTAFGTFDEARPILLTEVKKHPDRPAAWMDFRLFMDGCVNRRYEAAAEEAARISPLMRTGPSGMYAPSYTTGVNYYQMCRASRFIQTYPGIRGDWSLAFMPEDGRIGVWRGYGSQRPSHPWEFALRGFHVLGWWGWLPGGLPQMAVVAIDIKPARNFVEIGRQQMELKRGLGKLLLASKRAEPRVLIPYSQASAYVANVLERSYADSSSAATALLTEANQLYGFIADEQAQEGRTTGLKGAAFIFPGIDAMPQEAARAYAEAIGRGCFALADADVAARNGHGTLLKVGQLDEAFGVRREGGAYVASPEVEPITWTEAAPGEVRAAGAQMIKAIDKLSAAGGEVWAKFRDGTPAIVARTSAAGSVAVLLNTRFEWSARTNIRKAVRPEDEPDQLSAGATVKGVAAYVLARAGVEPPMRVTPAESRPQLVGAFANGRSRYYGGLFHNLKGPADVTVTLAEEAHTYDVREGRYLGRVASFKDRFDPQKLAKVYAQLPYRVTGVSAAADAPAKARGEVATISGGVQAEGTAATEYHVVRCEVETPDGARPRYYQRNLSAPGGRFSVSVPLALNAPAGAWKVDLRDVASGMKQTVTFEVR